MCLSVLYYNARRLISKLDELRANVASQKPHVVCIVETWLSDDVTDHELLLFDYQLQRLDRNRHGSGILVYVHNSLSYKVLLQGGPHNLEFLALSVSTKNNKHCLYLSFLPPPPHHQFLFLIIFVLHFCLFSPQSSLFFYC